MLIDCPECKKPVSDTTSACPGCGHTLTPEVVNRQRRIKKQMEDRTSLMGIGLVAFLLFMGLGLFMSRAPSTPSTSISPTYTSMYPQYDASADASLRALPSMRGFSHSDQDQIVRAAKGLTVAVNDLERQRGY